MATSTCLAPPGPSARATGRARMRQNVRAPSGHVRQVLGAEPYFGGSVARPLRHRCHYVCGGSRKQRQAPAPPVGTRAQSHRRTSAGAARALTDDRRLSAPYPRRKLRCSPFPRALSVCPVLSALSASRPAMMEMDELETPMERQQRSARARLFVVMEGGVQSGDTKVFDRGRHTHTHRLAS
jgi:hypothetical protein